MTETTCSPLYTGPLTISHGDTSAEVRAELFNSQEFYAKYEPDGWVHMTPGLRSWGGTARVPGLLYGLLNILGSECTVTLPDGRTGQALVTGYSEESVWLVEIAGVGSPPE